MKSKPEGLINQQKMIEILSEIHILEASIYEQFHKTKKDSMLTYFNFYKTKIIEKHGINEVVFDSSYSYYSKNIEELNIIYSTVLDSLNRRQSMFNIKTSKK